MSSTSNSVGAAISALDLAEAMDAAHDGIALFDEDGRFLYVNREFARLFGYESGDDLRGRSWAAVNSAEWMEQFRHDILPTLVQQRTWSGLLNGRQRDGSGWLGELSLTHLRAGRVLGICRRGRSAPGVAPARMAGGLGLMSKLSHEFRTPLATMQGVFYLLQRDLAGSPDDKRQRWLALLQDAMVKLRQLADDVSELNRLEASARQPAVEMELRPLLASFVNRRAGTPDETRLSFTCADDVPAMARVNEPVLRNILDQFINNALKYSAPETPVQIRAERHEGKLRLSVTDAGRGVPEAEQARLWQPFFRASNAASFSGTGLGLVQAARGAELTGATVGCRTEQDKGSVFWVDLAS